MNDQSPVNDTQPEPLDPHEARRQRRDARHEAREERFEARREAFGGSSNITWIAGAILILLGVGILLQNMGTFSMPLTNWWALFILLPAIGAFETAQRIYKKAGNRFTPSARSSFLVGVIISLVTAILLFNLDWDIFGPLLIILGGVGMIFNYMLPGKGYSHNP
jgi:cation transport ATPase